MRRRGRDGHGSEDSSEGTEDLSCDHMWRLRDLTFALPGRYVTEVREACGAFGGFRRRVPRTHQRPLSGLGEATTRCL